MSLSSVRKVYDRYSSFYDIFFGPILSPGRYVCARIINKIAPKNASILEVGVGTGLSLPMYREDLKINGIDISEKMLKKAQQCVTQKNMSNIKLQVMDAQNLEFEDNSFDFIVAMYVVSVVPDVNIFLNEIIRVAKPNAKILFVNHFSSEKPVMKFIEQKLSRFNKLIGFNSDFPIDSVLKCGQLELEECQNVNLFGYWKLLHCKVQKNNSKSTR